VSLTGEAKRREGQWRARACASPRTSITNCRGQKKKSVHTTTLKIFQATPPSLKLRSALSSRGSSPRRGVRSDQDTNKQREHCPPHTPTHALALRATDVMQGPNLVESGQIWLTVTAMHTRWPYGPCHRQCQSTQESHALHMRWWCHVVCDVSC
jgi:hypothetical protein